MELLKPYGFWDMIQCKQVTFPDILKEQIPSFSRVEECKDNSLSKQEKLI
jgi:hypothetical protein